MASDPASGDCGKIDATKLGATGYSLGGAGAISVGSNARVTSPQALRQRLERPSRRPLLGSLRHAGRVADDRSHREDEGDRSLAAFPVGYRRQPAANSLRPDSRGLRSRLDTLLGTTNWYNEFYKIEHEKDLFGNDEERVVKATNETIGRYFNDRLKRIFPGVAEPGMLRNSSNNPLYLLCFAAGNERGAPIARKIANSLLKEMR